MAAPMAALESRVTLHTRYFTVVDGQCKVLLHQRLAKGIVL
jgi:hypothetical protein